MPSENENLISNEIRLYMLNPFLYPTIRDALQYIDENFEGTEFEKGREMGT